MKFGQKNSFNCIKKLNVNGKDYSYFSLAEAEKMAFQAFQNCQIL